MQSYNTNTAEATDTARRCASLLRVVLDPSASDGEAINHATHFARQARRAGLTPDVLAQAIAPVSRQLPPPKASEPPPACWICMPFGKYAGLELAEIAKRDLGYLRWLADKLTTREDIQETAADELALPVLCCIPLYERTKEVRMIQEEGTPALSNDEIDRFFRQFVPIAHNPRPPADFTVDPHIRQGVRIVVPYTIRLSNSAYPLTIGNADE